MFAQIRKEPFLEIGSSIDGCDDAVMDLIRLAELDEELFLEVKIIIEENLLKAKTANKIGVL